MISLKCRLQYEEVDDDGDDDGDDDCDGDDGDDGGDDGSGDGCDGCDGGGARSMSAVPLVILLDISIGDNEVYWYVWKLSTHSVTPPKRVQ